MTENGEQEMQDTPTRLTIDGRDIWRFADGTVLPVVSGGQTREEPEGGLQVDDPPAPARQEPTREPTVGGLTEEEFQRRLNEERERVRKEEKDKLYADQKELKDKLKDYEKREKERAEAEEAARREAEEQKKRAEEEELSAREIAERRHQEAMEEIRQLREERERDRFIMERERELARINEYRSTRVQEELKAETIPAEFVEFISGTTEEEIEASIVRVREKAEEVFTNVAAAFRQQYGEPPTGDEPPAPRRPMPFTGAPPADPLSDPERRQKTYSLDELRNMSMEEYIKNRPALLEASRNQYYGGRGA